MFFEKVLGPVSQRNDKRIWFQVGKSRVGLLKGDKPGVNHFCVLAEPFNYAAVTGFTRDAEGFLDGVVALDAESGREFQARARVVVNAAGLTVDEFIRHS